MPQIYFDTKENNNRRREAEFLKLNQDQRFWAFVHMVDEFAIFQTKKPSQDKGNFILEKNSDNGTTL